MNFFISFKASFLELQAWPGYSWEEAKHVFEGVLCSVGPHLPLFQSCAPLQFEGFWRKQLFCFTDLPQPLKSVRLGTTKNKLQEEPKIRNKHAYYEQWKNAGVAGLLLWSTVASTVSLRWIYVLPKCFPHTGDVMPTCTKLEPGTRSKGMALSLR